MEWGIWLLRAILSQLPWNKIVSYEQPFDYINGRKFLRGKNREIERKKLTIFLVFGSILHEENPRHFLWFAYLSTKLDKNPSNQNFLLTLEKEFQHQFGKFLPLSDRQSKVRSDDCLKRRQLVKNHDQLFKYYYLKWSRHQPLD